jgi:amylosucrase
MTDDCRYREATTYDRLMPRVKQRLASLPAFSPAEYAVFSNRLNHHFSQLFSLLFDIYGHQYDFYFHLEELLVLMGTAWLERKPALKQRDLTRESEPFWYQSHQQMGAVCYVDLFADDINGMIDHIPYFKELGITYLHLMPLFDCPPEENDGGYAVSSFRKVNPALGTIQDLQTLTDRLHEEGISLALDLVFNHTSNEHEWAQKALAGDPRYERFYFIFDDRSLPDQYERTLREIFPDEHPGAFTYLEEQDKWVWTTFHSYQWDLNYQNQDVFNAMADEMLAIANLGTDVIRLDAVPFIWKQMGTSCENLPLAHTLIRAFNAVCRIAAPSLLFKSEAIVHPDDVKSYINMKECQISYNPLFMALLWNTLATREVNLLQSALVQRHQLPDGCAWVNYVRCHDDIGWTFADEDASKMGINGFDHRRFLNTFYTGRFEGSFARGLPFQENLKTGDARISGTCASLAGLEFGLQTNDQTEIEFGKRRILLLHGLILTLGGMPLLYLGDELGVLNDYSFTQDPGKAHDSRWVHRPQLSDAMREKRHEAGSIEHEIYDGLLRLINIRKQQPAFSGPDLQVIATENNHVIGFLRKAENHRLLVFANFAEKPQQVAANVFRLYGLTSRFQNLLTQQSMSLENLTLQPYELAILKALDAEAVF